MANSTADFWSVDGISLQTLGWGIDKWGSGLEAPPKRRGGFLTIPGRPGQLWRPQVADSRTLPFAMWVLNCDEDGVTPSGVTAQENQMRDNWEMLRPLLWGRGDQQLVLTKRMQGGYIEAVGQASFANGLEPVGYGMQMARFTVDLFMADPYFYGDPESSWVTTSGLTIDNYGDDPALKLTLAFSGAASGQYILTNTTTGDVLTIDNFGTITVDTWDFTATKTAASILGDVSSTGDPFWMSLARGENDLDINQGSCTVSWAPVYL